MNVVPISESPNWRKLSPLAAKDTKSLISDQECLILL